MIELISAISGALFIAMFGWFVIRAGKRRAGAGRNVRSKGSHWMDGSGRTRGEYVGGGGYARGDYIGSGNF